MSTNDLITLTVGLHMECMGEARAGVVRGQVGGQRWEEKGRKEQKGDGE